MYRYDQFDHQIAKERVAQFRDQVRRRLSGELKEDEFRILRLQNGVYMQVPQSPGQVRQVSPPSQTLLPQ